MLDLNGMQIFAEVAKQASFTTAAKALGLPKSTVSRSLANLEDRLGVQLLERTTRNVRLTDAGEIYLERCRRMLDEAEDADLVMNSLRGTPRGRLRIGAPIAFIRFSLGPQLPSFLAKFPEMSVSLHILNGSGQSRENALDIAIRSGDLEDSELIVKPLKTIRLGIYASPFYLKKQARAHHPSDLRGMSCITTTCGALGSAADGTLWRLKRGAEVQDVRVESRIAVPDPFLNYELALHGLGLAQLSQALVKEHVEAKRLIRVLPEWEPDTVRLRALYSARLSASPKLRAFLSFLEGCV
ncbi:LysR family transcriptional regulator [Terriglobus albidus]|uniref:LysR family transcriptional regulator n=1 Tax=Terriglobus albidus TaxID=1592106 RepID=A0A5B9ECE5_9BACT|nr:LysR family transcriptional regulator [Terriglobus albidus]QEE28795.1 LysR family transcriptional regulator [Terriglobus albidus]